MTYRDLFLPPDFPPSYPPNTPPNRSDQLSEWGMLALGQTVGKSGVIIFDPASFNTLGDRTRQKIDLLQLQGEDRNAQNVCLTLGTPKINLRTPTALELSGLTPVQSFQDNLELVGSPAAPANPPTFFNSFALISWGTGGQSHVAEVDLQNGLCVNLSCSFLRVSIIVEAVGLDNRGLAGVVGHYELRSTIGPGVPKPNNAQRTVVISPVPLVGAESAIFAVPRFAKTVYLSGNSAAGTVFVGEILFQRDNQVVTFYPSARFLFSSNVHEPVNIPNGALYFRVRNNAGGDYAMNAVFDLSI